ncbi:hypothetical protein K7711_46435 [Nocardia sp. CA2R105]|uniref:hypothetical protein n=1 Tax=Nocardia coffeae TaxID=2873381 RepID=UPI001CA7838B|nr:hypothetical protein [Nocardia coffeae]MBY8863972.1 hypothetical protein [Nocardia coffeae]
MSGVTAAEISRADPGIVMFGGLATQRYSAAAVLGHRTHQYFECEAVVDTCVDACGAPGRPEMIIGSSSTTARVLNWGRKALVTDRIR